MIHLDTHLLVWLTSRGRRRLSHRALSLIQREPCQVSPVVTLELEMLFEKGRLGHDGAGIAERLAREIGLTTSSAPLALIVEHARSFAWTRDPFDRLIVANAMADEARLVTADTVILEHFSGAVW